MWRRGILVVALLGLKSEAGGEEHFTLVTGAGEREKVLGGGLFVPIPTPGSVPTPTPRPLNALLPVRTGDWRARDKYIDDLAKGKVQIDAKQLPELIAEEGARFKAETAE